MGTERGSPTETGLGSAPGVTVSADAAARRRALDPAASFIVQAPAGSGKTALLTQRFLRLLALVDAPEQIVAITFTRKAAAEMRRRIVLALRGEEPAAHSDAEHDRLTRELAEAARVRAREKDWALEQHPARLRIHTIDAFCHSLAAQAPVLSRAGSELEIADDAREMYREAARRTLARVSSRDVQDSVLGDAHGDAVATLLLHRDVQVLPTEQLIVGMLGRRDQWLPIVLQLSGVPLRRRLEDDLARELHGQLRAAHRAFPPALLTIMSELLAFAAQRGEGDALAAWLGRPQSPQADLADLDRWRALARLALTADGDWRRNVDVRQGFAKEAPREREAMKAVLARIQDEEALRRELEAVRELPPARFSDGQWRTLEALIAVLQLAAAELELVFRETGRVDYPAVLGAALSALGTPDAPGELALAMDQRIRHLLIDEYQDTSLAQFGLLVALTAQWVPGDGRTIFCVGDPMQSIYRFRQAEVGLFLRTRERGLGDLGLEALRLEHNFRSQRGLVDWFNRVFAIVLPHGDDIARGAVRHAPSSAVHAASEPAVCVHPLFGAEASETDAILAELEAIERRAPQARIGVLTRQRAHVSGLAAALRQRGVRFQAVELEALASRPVVRDLLSLARALLHQGDRTAWLSLLRAPLCGLTLADLEALTRGAERRTIRELLAAGEVLARLSSDGRQRCESVRSALEHGLQRGGHLSIVRRVEGVWLALGGPATTRDAAALEDAASFFDRLRALEARGPLPAGEALDEGFADLYAQADPDAPARLQIMTIHKAKGLEFDVVLLPGLGRGRSRNEPPLLHWLEVPQERGEPGLLLAPIARKGGEGDPHASYVWWRQRECADLERARLLYVAATRARHELHLFGHVSVKERDGAQEMGAPEAGSPLALLWSAVRKEFENGFVQRVRAAVQPAPSTPRAILRRHVAGWVSPPPLPTVGAGAVLATAATTLLRPSFEWASEVSRHVGTVVHAELERWSRSGAPADATSIERSGARFARLLAALGVPADRRRDAGRRVTEALTQTLADERGRWLFASSHRDARGELAVTGLVQGVLVNAVIDRTFVDTAGTRWIVDFKTGSHEGGAVEKFLDNEVVRYREQLERYATLLAGLGHGLELRGPVRAGLYFPMLAGWREWSV